MEVQNKSDVFEKYHINISDEVLDLLWIKQLVKRNNMPNLYDIDADLGEMGNISNDPSFIDLKLKIEETHDNDIDETFYPNYEEFSPKERYLYFKYLEDPFNENSNLTFVRLFYFGLERFLLTPKYEKAIDVMFKLRKSLKNKKFYKYSISSIISVLFLRKRYDLLDYYYHLNKELLGNGYNMDQDLFFLCKYFFKEQIELEDLVYFHTSFDFKLYYYENYKEIFIHEYDLLIKEMFNVDKLYVDLFISEDDINKMGKNTKIYFSNSSLWPEMYYWVTKDKPLISLPDFLSYPKFIEKNNKILLETINRTKCYLKQARSNKIKIKRSKDTKKSNVKEPKFFDRKIEKELLREHKSILKYISTPKEKRNANYGVDDDVLLHETYGGLAYFYCKYIDDIPKCIGISSDYCLKDIEVLEKIKKNTGSYYSDDSTFKCLLKIYIKQNKYVEALDFCKYVINYYENNVNYSKYYERKMIKINKMMNEKNETSL